MATTEADRSNAMLSAADLHGMVGSNPHCPTRARWRLLATPVLIRTTMGQITAEGVTTEKWIVMLRASDR